MSIFVSYRRRDTAGHAGRLVDRLREEFGHEGVFQDIDIPAGVDFVEHIHRTIGAARILIVLIGDDWLVIEDDQGRRRLDDPTDFVRTEIRSALREGLLVIPVLVERASMPPGGGLPEDIRQLSQINALELSDSRWDYDVGRLVDHLLPVVAPGGLARPPTPLEKGSFWRTVPGIITLIAGFIGAVAVLVTTLASVGILGSNGKEGGGESPSDEIIESYYTTDGSRPEASPTCDGVLSLCLGMPIERALQLLGTEDDRYGDQATGDVYRAWELSELRITIEADSVGSITGFTASMPADPRSRLALPGGLILGEARMGDVSAGRGPPHDTDTFSAENVVFYDWIYCTGPEGSHKLTFGYATESGGPEDPGSVDSVGGEPITSFDVALGCST